MARRTSTGIVSLDVLDLDIRLPGSPGLRRRLSKAKDSILSIEASVRPGHVRHSNVNNFAFLCPGAMKTVTKKLRTLVVSYYRRAIRAIASKHKLERRYPSPTIS